MISIIVPVFNEIKTVGSVLERLTALRTEFDIEIVVVDDGSTDGTGEYLKLRRPHVDCLVLHKENLGKGAAVKTGLRYAKGQVIVIQDADLEYNVFDLRRVIEPVLNGTAHFCFGNRFASSPDMRPESFLANKFLSFLVSLIVGKQISDVETCYKAFKRELLGDIEIRESGFGIEPELTIKVVRAFKKKYKRTPDYCEVPISYSGRTRAEGKKLRYLHGFEALFCIARYSFC